MKKILVAIDDSKFSEEVMKFASKLAKADKAELFIGYIFEVPRSMALEAEIPEESAKGDKVLERALEVAEAYRLKAETDFIQSRSAGSGIVDEAKDVEAELIVIGMTAKDRVDGSILGNTVNYVLKNSPIPVAILKEPLE